MGELSESLKKISLGSILVVVGIISILTLGIYWYVFSEDPSSIPSITSSRKLTPEAESLPVPGTLSGAPVKHGPDDRTVIVETPSHDSVLGEAADDEEANEDTAAARNKRQAENTVEPGNLSIQVGAFSKAGGAEKLADELDKKGFTYLISSSDGMYRVFVGDFASKNQASEVLDRLKRSGFSGYVRAVP